MASIRADEKSLANEALTLHEMFRVVGDQLTSNDVKVLSFIYGGLYNESDFLSKAKDGYNFLVSLQKLGRVDESNFKHILHLLRILTRQDLVQHLTLRRRKTVEPDPVDEYLEASTTRIPLSRKRVGGKTCVSVTKHVDCDEPSSAKRPRRRNSARSGAEGADSQSSTSTPERVENLEDDEEEIRKKVTCARLSAVRTWMGDLQGRPRLSVGATFMKPKKFKNHLEKRFSNLVFDIRLRVRAEYCQHENALDGNVFSNKPELIERQFEKFAQANTILKSRDLGSIICDIKFSELTYLDAFWRDYINGSLLEALKGVFITESLKQAVGHEAIKLLVNVDEDDYEAGRLKLLQNLSD